MLVPTFGIAADAAALARYQELMPGYEIIGFTGSWLSDDAIHCRAMGIHDKQMMYVDMAPLPTHWERTVPSRSRCGSPTTATSASTRRSASVLGEHHHSQLRATRSSTDRADRHVRRGVFPQPSGTVVEYYVVGQGCFGRSWVRPGRRPSAPTARMWPATLPENVPEFTTGLVLEPLSPNPFTDGTTLRFSSVLSGGSI
ncbi:MAG: hypothetical protein IPK72_17605 [Candidatus Eisenbacteria bacterium]|nr:hypothetical protein [Candidatus Eisenbacteria bacterium]